MHETFDSPYLSYSKSVLLFILAPVNITSSDTKTVLVTSRIKIYKLDVGREKDGGLNLTSLRAYSVLNLDDKLKRMVSRDQMNSKENNTLRKWWRYVGKCIYKCWKLRKNKTSSVRKKCTC